MTSCISSTSFTISPFGRRTPATEETERNSRRPSDQWEARCWRAAVGPREAGPRWRRRCSKYSCRQVAKQRPHPSLSAGGANSCASSQSLTACGSLPSRPRAAAARYGATPRSGLRRRRHTTHQSLRAAVSKESPNRARSSLGGIGVRP
eukprot:8912624-Alexandrium_andersonii.AAC.1